MHGLCDDDYGMELLVAGRIASLDLLVIDVYEGDKLLEHPSAFVWPGCNCGGLTDRSNFVISERLLRT